MTAIVGLVENGVVWIGADSAGSTHYSISNRKEEKVFINGDLLIGYTSSFRMGQLLQYVLKPPANNCESDIEYLITELVPAIKKVFKENGFERIKEGVDSGGTFLLGYRGNLYKIENDYQVYSSIDGYDACGSGESYSLGALFTIINNKTVSISDKLLLSLEAAEYFNPNVRRPFTIISKAK